MRFLLATVVASALLGACASPSSYGTPVGASGVGTAAAGSQPFKIYVANTGDGTITAFKSNGSETTPTIQTGSGSSDYLFGMTVGADGKIYALNFDPLLGSGTSGTLTTYEPNGGPTTPTITIEERGFFTPVGVAVDASGKIYVLSAAHDGSGGIVTTYRPDGKRTKPTFTTGPDSDSITVDANGKIYVSNNTGRRGGYSVTTYLPNGTPTTPTITRDLHQPVSVAVSSDGTIYVANVVPGGPDGTGAGAVTTYSADGTELERFRSGGSAPGGIAIDSSGKIYVASDTAYASMVKAFSPGGERTKPTIRKGVYEPSAIAIH